MELEITQRKLGFLFWFESGAEFVGLFCWVILCGIVWFVLWYDLYVRYGLWYSWVNRKGFLWKMHASPGRKRGMLCFGTGLARIMGGGKDERTNSANHCK